MKKNDMRERSTKLLERLRNITVFWNYKIKKHSISILVTYIHRGLYKF